jgi:hypothetical protein
MPQEAAGRSMAKWWEALTLFIKPINRVADSLDALHQDFLRYAAANRIPDLPSEEAVKAVESEPAIGAPIKEDWELAIDEEMAFRKAEADREERAE